VSGLLLISHIISQNAWTFGTIGDFLVSIYIKTQ
jgi:hypothetical protein